MAVVVTKLEIARPPEEVFGLAVDTSVWLAISPELRDIEPRGPISQGTRGRMMPAAGRGAGREPRPVTALGTDLIRTPHDPA